MARVLSRITVKANGMVFDSERGLSFTHGGEKRTPKVTAKGVAGYQVEIEASEVELSIPVIAGLSLDEIKAITTATLSIEYDTGQTFSVSNAFVSDTLQTSDQDGNTKIKFNGDPAVQVS